MDGTIRVRSVAWFATAVVLTLVCTLLVTQAWSVGAAPGDDDSTFVPVPPCRLFDMRPDPFNVGPKSTPLGPGESNVYTQQVTGTNGDCVIPADAVGVSMNVTIVDPTAQSNLRIFPADVATPNASNLNWLPGQSPTPNKADTKLSPDGKIKLFNQNGTVNVLADVVGYYTNKSLIELRPIEMPFDIALDKGEIQQFGTNGPISFEAACLDNAGDPEAIIRAKTSANDSVVMDSVWVFFDGGIVEGYLLSSTADGDRVMFDGPTSAATQVANYIDGGFILTASGEYLGLDGETLAIGVNYAGNDCVFVGTYTMTTRP